MKESPKIVAFNGGSFYQPGEAIPKIVTMLEDALKDAKSGTIRACAIAYVVQSDTSTPVLVSDFFAEMGHARDLYAAVGRMTRRFNNWLDE